MRGVITGREIRSNLGIIWREFGAGCLARCLFALLLGRDTTFLHIAFQAARPPEGRR
jgi:hypothetical protein